MSEGTLTRLKEILRKFTLQELSELVIHILTPELFWNEIKTRLIKRKITITKVNVVNFLLKIVKKNFKDDEINRKCTALLSIAIGKNKLKTWYVLRLNKKNDDTPSLLPDIERSIASTFRRKSVFVDLHCEPYMDLFILTVTKKLTTNEKNKRRSARKSPPIFFKYYPGFPYLFCAIRNAPDNIIEGITIGLGYTTCTIIQLSGQSCPDLLKLLCDKDSGDGNLSFEAIKPKQTIEERENCIVYGQQKQRAAYANQLYGNTPPKLETLTVTVKNAEWTPIAGFEEMNGTSLTGASLQIKSKHVIGSIKEMIEMGIIEYPIPAYMERITHGRNVMKINQI